MEKTENDIDKIIDFLYQLTKDYGSLLKKWDSLKGQGLFKKEYNSIVELEKNIKHRDELTKKVDLSKCTESQKNTLVKVIKSLNNQYFNIYIRYADFYINKRDWSSAKEYYDLLIHYLLEIYKDNKNRWHDYKIASSYFSNRAYVKLKLNKSESALKDIKRALEIDDENVPALTVLASYQGRQNKYSDALATLLKAYSLSPNNYLIIYDLSACYASLRQYDDAIRFAEKGIKLNKLNPKCYHILGEIYEMYKINQKSDLYYNLYLYYSFKSDSIILSSSSLKRWKGQPYNFNFLIESFEIDFNEFSLIEYSRYLKLTEDLFYFNEFNNTRCSDHEAEGNSAILKYYCGSPVACFIDFDEKLDIKYSRLTSRELFYYAKSSYDIRIEEHHLIDYCIKEILNYDNIRLIDSYYLGQLYLMNEELQLAKQYFLSSKDLLPSQLMLIFLETDFQTKKKLIDNILVRNSKAIKNLLGVNSKTELKMSNSFDSQFHDFLFRKEVIMASQELYELKMIPYELKPNSQLEIWDAYYLTNTEKNKIYLELRKREQINNLKNIASEFEKKVSIISDKAKSNYLKKIKYNLIENHSSDVAHIFDWLLNAKEKNYDIENQIGRSIKEFKIESPNLFVYLISYFYFSEDIDSKQAFTLFVYLTQALCENKTKKMKNIIRTLIPSDHSKLFLVSIGLSPNLFSIVSIVQALNLLFKGYRDFELKEKSHYLEFKESIWKYVSSERDTLNDFAFNKKFQCFPNILKSEN